MLFKFIAARCVNGDVRLHSDNRPDIFWDGKWSPICRQYFSKNQDGAKLFCAKLGYGSGSIRKLMGYKGRYKGDSFWIGQCKAGDVWPNCSAGCNDQTLGGRCTSDQYSSCTNNYKIKIFCGRNDTLLSSSCKGNK